jgi:hypothetical protein
VLEEVSFTQFAACLSALMIVEAVFLIPITVLYWAAIGAI